MGAIGNAMDSIRSIDLRQLTMQAISLGMMVSSVMILWKTLMCITSSESPIVVVLSGSMEPGFQKGDILFLHMSKAPIRAGEIVVFHVEGKDIPIVHRVIKVHERHDTKEIDVLTKGDDNDVDDDEGGIYADYQQWLQQQDVAGRIVGFLGSFYNIFCDSLQLYAAASSFNEMLGSSDSHDEEEESERLPERSERSEQMGVMDTGGTESSAAHLRNLLTECAEFVAQCSWQRADRMISILSTRGSTRGDSTERLVAQFTRALRQRSDLALGRLPPAAAAAGATERELESAYLCLNQVTPFIRFAHLTANQAILEALDTDSPSIHVVDINIMQGVQWPPFMQALAERPGGPPSHIRLTGAGPDAEALRKTGRRLERFADTLGLRFEFNPWIIDDDISSLAISTRPGESLAINCVLHLHELLDEAHNERLKNFLVRIRSLEPKVVALAEREADHNRPSFTDRFIEALNHYSILFDSLEATLPPKSQERLDVEQVCFGREITNIVAMEGPGRNERHQNFERWSEVMNECGFTSLPLSEFALSQARLLLRLHYPSEGYQLHTQNKAAFLGWQNSPLFSVSSWH